MTVSCLYIRHKETLAVLDKFLAQVFMALTNSVNFVKLYTNELIKSFLKSFTTLTARVTEPKTGLAITSCFKKQCCLCIKLYIETK